jgi:DNA-binding GntR family transcriptional regulator
MSSKPTADDSASDSRYATSDVLWRAGAAGGTGGESLVAKVYETLWKQIVEGERLPGERLIDAELVDELGVSRTPIRQALYQLQQARLIEASTGRGFHVVLINADDVRELYDLRTILEVAAVRAAAPRIAPAALQAAYDEHQALRRLPEQDAGPRFLRSDVSFHHQLVAGNSGNQRLAESIAAQRAQMSLFLVGGTRVPGGIPTAIDEHLTVLEALLAGDIERAAAAMEQHVQRVKQDALTMLDERPRRVRRMRPAS